MGMSFDARELRNALGQFATGVCLITVVTPEGEALAMTANSFSSVSLDPPLVLWSLQNNSDVYDAFASPQHFAINVLTSEQLDHSNHYARKEQHQLKPDHYTAGSTGAPIISGALVSFECELEVTHPAGDHLIIIGRVTDMQRAESGDPLLFFSGGYRYLTAPA
jgi:flavin reductase (DIM6/NTAB) family NADH-FMN oxidoreductase RutF